MESIIQFIQTRRIEAVEELVLDKLDSLSAKYDWVIRADVFFKQEKKDQLNGKICEIRLSCPGPRIFASSNEDSFEAAAAETIQDLEELLEALQPAK